MSTAVPPEAPPSSAAVDPGTPAVRFRGASVARGRTTVLEGVDLDVDAGRVTALVGPNGAGKSTLLHAVAGLLALRAGTLTVLDRPAAEQRRRVAYVLQSTAVSEHLPITVREVVMMGRFAHRGGLARMRADDREIAGHAMERLGVADLGRRHLGELSGGQRQRVFVAQGLAQDADVLLLDEPVAGLDAPSQESILEVLAAERAAGRAVVVSTHDLADAAAADRVVLLAGRVVAVGPPTEVLVPEHLAAAYGGRLVRLAGGVLLLDEGAHH